MQVQCGVDAGGYRRARGNISMRRKVYDEPASWKSP